MRGKGATALRGRHRPAWVACLAVTAAGAVVATAAMAAEGPSLRSIKADIDAAHGFLAEGRPTKAVAKLSAAVDGIEQVVAEDGVPSGLRSLLDRCKALKNDLEFEGADVSGITIPTLKAASPAAAPAKPAMADGKNAPKKGPADVPGPRPPRPANQAVSFSAEVAPVLVRACGGCHIAGRKGGFQFASYADLMQTGVVQRGAGESSRLVEVILSGDMPRGGGKVAPDEIGAIMKWIDAGAAFDGSDPRQPMASLAVPAKPAAKPAGPKAVVVSEMEAGAVSFASDVAPIMMESCFSCHGGKDDAEGGLSMKTFERLLAGGGSGQAIVPGRGADSLLVKKLRGVDIEGQRMPLNRPPLTAEVIAMIERWIDEGARLDARSAADELPTVAAAGRTRKMSHAELADVRFAAAQNLWRRSLPDTPPEIAAEGDVRVIGNLSTQRTLAVAKVAASAWGAVQRQLGKAGPPLKGGIVVYAFDRNFDFSEFWQVRFGNERPRDVFGTGGIAGDVAYAALVVPGDEGGEDAELLLTEQMTAAVVAARGGPRWFATGLGRFMAAKLVPRAPVVKAWKTGIPAAVAALDSPDAILAADAEDSEQARLVAGGFVGALVGNWPRGRAFMEKLDAGTPFEQAFAAVFGGPAEPLLAAWTARESAGSRGR